MNNQLINPWIYYDALQIFTNDLFGSVRSVLINGEPWFMAKDVADCLGYIRARDAINDHVHLNDKIFIKSGEIPPLNIQSNYGAYLINESGIYSLIFSSKLPMAKEFQHWVTSEVLPAMRQIGFSNSMRLLQKENERLQTENIRLNAKIKDLEMYNNNLICAII